ALVIAAAVVQQADAEAAFATLPDVVRGKLAGGDAKPDAGFAKLYDALLETHPTF
ncbi:MAG: hypothetical protein JO090_08550, partial [Rhizobacter sp.]|nr:hypothetical protein [Rhizobacter sp.]